MLDFHPLPPPLFSPLLRFFTAYYFCPLQNLKVEFSVGVIYFVRKLKENMSRDMTKPTKWVCAQRRLRSAQADLSLRWAHSHFVGFVMSRLTCAEAVLASTRATEILKSKSVRSTDDVIDVILTCVQQSQTVTKTNDSSFSSKSVSEIDYFSNTVQPVVSKRSRDNPKLLA